MFTEVPRCAGQVLSAAPGWSNNCLPILANFATIIAALLGAPSLLLAAGALYFAGLQTKYAREAIIRQREQDRGTILLALRIEVDAIRNSANVNLQVFSDAQAWQNSQEGETGYKRSFIWTPLPMIVVEQAIREAYVLKPTDDQLRALQNLRLRLLRVNTLINTKIAILSALVQADLPRGINVQYHRWSEIKADSINLSVAAELPGLMKACDLVADKFKLKTEQTTGT